MGNEFLFYGIIVIVIIVLTIVISTWPQENIKEQFNDNKRNIIIRILGNDLNGLHGNNQTYNNLKFTLENEPQFSNCDKIFILNRIIDKEKKQKYIELLNKYKIKYVEIPIENHKLKKFKKMLMLLDFKVKKKSDNKTEKLSKNVNKFMKKMYKANLYIVNNNGSRNTAIKYGKDHNYKYIFPLDSNAFFTKKQYNDIFTNLNHDTQYIILTQKRISDKSYTNNDILVNDELADKLPNQEPQICFRYDTQYNFNVAIPYGASPKAELLRMLKVPGKWNLWSDNESVYSVKDRPHVNVKWQNLSSVYRLSSENNKNNTINNYENRQSGLFKLIESIP